MNEIIKKENGDLFYAENGKLIFSKDAPVNIKEREIFLSSRNFIPINKIEDKNEVIKPIHSYINITIMDRGFKYEKDDIKYLCTKVSDDIMRDFNGYTLEEIRLAFHYGVRGEFGEYMGLNPVTFSNWLKAYREELTPVVNKLVQPLLPQDEEVIPSQQEIDETSVQILTKVYTELVKTNTYDFYDIGNVIFKFLSRIGLLIIEEEDMKKLRERSVEHFKKMITDRNKDLIGKKKHFHMIDIPRAFEQIEEESNPQFEQQIDVGVMRLALFRYLSNCAKENVDLISLVNENLKNTYSNE